MNSGLYAVDVVCPVCEEGFTALKVRTSAIRLEKIDEDLCAHYTDINPLFYEHWVCGNCGYAGFGANFTTLHEKDIKKLRGICLNKFINEQGKNPFELSDFHKRLYNYIELLGPEGERNNLAAIEAYKILFSSLEIRNKEDSLKAKVLLRIGWIYRFMGDPKELEYLDNAADLFAKAYSVEDLSKEKFDTATCAYMIGELNRRTGKMKEAAMWLGRVIGMPRSDNTAKIVEKARDQLQLVKSSM